MRPDGSTNGRLTSPRRPLQALDVNDARPTAAPASAARPLITVLLPLKDYHRVYLARALNSVLTQTSPRWELLVISERSRLSEHTDVLGSVLDDPRVRMVPRESPKLAGALNTGMRNAATEFTAILLGDDMWAPQAVDVLTRGVERSPGIDVFHSSRVIVDENDTAISTVRRAREFTLDEFVNGSQAKHLLCWRREVGLAIGGVDETLDSVGPDDYDFPWSMAEAGARFQPVSDVLYFHRDHRDCFRLTTHLPFDVHVRALRRIHEKHGADPDRSEAALAQARATYLRQCLYRSRADRWVKERLGYDAHRGVRLSYR